jgi:hypothetical protein
MSIVCEGYCASVQIGLVVSRDEPIGDLAARLRKHGVEVSDVWDPDLDEAHEPHHVVGSTTP